MPSYKDFAEKQKKICVVGLGYVGLPLAVLFSSKYPVIGFDIDPRRIEELISYEDHTGEVEPERLSASDIDFTHDPVRISDAAVIVMTVPTPIDAHRRPDLSFLTRATEAVAERLTEGSVVVYESTVYPGATEELCIPILERGSGLEWKKDFFVGYSPERVNPGDKEHTIDRIVKVVSGDCRQSADFLVELYGSVIPAGIHRAPDIKTAEAAKVIENTQRDLNIALMNELAIIFNRLGIETREVLAAAETKWNFLKFYPGLVGGHCIGVDPYYLTFKAESIGYHPEVILAGRRINDGMGKYIAEMTVKKMIAAGKSIKGSKVLILGITFKEDVPDIRNTRVIDVYRGLQDFEIKPFVYDPYASKEEVEKEYGIGLLGCAEEQQPYDAVISAVKHKKILESMDIQRLKSIQHVPEPILLDIKGLYERIDALKEDIIYWAL